MRASAWLAATGWNTCGDLAGNRDAAVHRVEMATGPSLHCHLKEPAVWFWLQPQDPSGRCCSLEHFSSRQRALKAFGTTPLLWATIRSLGERSGRLRSTGISIPIIVLIPSSYE